LPRFNFGSGTLVAKSVFALGRGAQDFDQGVVGEARVAAGGLRRGVAEEALQGALAAVKPPQDWHPITERFLDRAVTAIDVVPHAHWKAKSDLAAVFRLGGHLRTLSDLLKRRVRKHLRDLDQGQATRFLRLPKTRLSVLP
jgi:hypothetical protein